MFQRIDFYSIEYNLYTFEILMIITNRFNKVVDRISIEFIISFQTN